ncbi:unnamed protein product [Mytilus coruscus]|uniref:HSPA12A n=1 Tax=Mytilus coruscus TaxID=42192 RepID=A0A6J8D9A5_MYTCO|nr:unnamed protein product [Mytilus coruscus]
MDEYYYFRRFKMTLHNERITLDTMLTEERGKQMKALEIFCIAIKYLKEQMIKKLNSKFLTMKVDIKEEDIQYVLTVPAIWADQSKLFMRKAAEKELRLDVEKEANRFLQTIKPGMKFMVIDLGGGTADITVHQQQHDETLEEVVPPSGGPWGGTSVDNAYIEFLKDLFGAEVVEGLRKEDLEDYFHLLHEFEIKKRSITTKSETNIVITMPVGLMDLVKKKKGNMNNQIKRTKYKDTVSVEGQKLHIKPNTFRNLFKETIDELLNHLTELFADPLLSNLKNVIMVGGFSECELVQMAVRNKFGENRKIIIPDESGLAVLKGAVLFGRQKKKITKRILKKTYGIQSWPEWDPDIHPETKKIRMGGTDRCKDVFFKFASIRDKVEEGHTSSQIFQALNPNEKTLECAIYTSTDPNPRYVTDPTCQRLGNLIVDLPKLKEGETLEIEETLVFGGTELLFRAKI